MTAPPRDALTFPLSQSQHIDQYIPHCSSSNSHVTLTFATSLDSNLSFSPGVQTILSGPESKAMTHYLRSKHDAILIGVGTAVADNPSLNCRIEGLGGYGGSGLQGQPRPVILDPKARWEFTAESKCMQLAVEGRGKAPWIITCVDMPVERREILEQAGGKAIVLEPVGETGGSTTSRIEWEIILSTLHHQGIWSIMVEGGGSVINELLSPRCFDLVNSVIATIAPTWLGKGGVQVCPKGRVENGTRVAVGRLKDVRWVPLGEDVVLCGRPKT